MFDAPEGLQGHVGEEDGLRPTRSRLRVSDAFDTAPHTTHLLNLYLRLTLATYLYNRYLPHSQPTAVHVTTVISPASPV